MRTYQETHPWITFRLDLSDVSYSTWILLGEAQAICQQIAGVPLLPAVAERLHQIFLAKGVLATTAIEGNTLTEEEVLQRIAGNLKLPPSKEYLGQEIDNIVEACNQIGNEVLSGKVTTLQTDDIKTYNRLILQNLTLSESVVPGEIRDHSVIVGNYRGAPPEDCEYLLERLCQWLNDELVTPDESQKIVFGILKAIVAHLYIAWIHPFGDGNGRTARLIEFQIMLLVGVPSTAAQLLSNHYNQTRSAYYRQLDASSRSRGDIVPFIEYALQGLVDGLRDQLEQIESQQLHVHWINFVHDNFRGMSKESDRRRKQLILALSMRAETVAIHQIRHISPQIAEAYANLTDKTIRRDIDKLASMELIKIDFGGVRVRSDRMEAFLPGVRSDSP